MKNIDLSIGQDILFPFIGRIFCRGVVAKHASCIPSYVHILFPGTYEYITLHSKGEYRLWMELGPLIIRFF